MDINQIYGTIFPMSIDDNNRYIDLNGSEINSVQLLEPTVGVSEIVLINEKRRNRYSLPDKTAFRIPLIKINNTYIDQTILTNFYVDYSSFIPTIMIEFLDIQNELLSTTTLKDGAIIQLYIGGLGDELYYKSIRQDFIVTDVKKVGGGNQNRGDNIQYRVFGKLNVPVGYKKESWSNNESTSTQELFNLSVYTGLGFATNFTFETIDKMKWENMANITYFDFIQDITAHACYSPNTFFTSFIDQYNVLNFVEVHSLLSHGGKKTDNPAVIYNSSHSLNEKDNNNENDKTKDRLNIKDGNGESYNAHQKVSYYFLSNNEYFNGWTNFIEEYIEITDGHSTVNDGYRKHVGYSDSNVGNWGTVNCEFVIPPIDNLYRDSSTQQIKELGDLDKNTYIPMNLMHTNNFDYQKETTDNVDDMTEVESFVYYGEVDTSNTYKQYYFAQAQNDYQMKCLKKCGLKIKLQNYNPSITKFSRIWIDIYDKNPHSSIAITPQSTYKATTYNEKEININNRINKENKNKIKYKDEGVIENILYAKNGDKTTKPITKNYPMGEYNRSLSGWYVVTELKFIYDSKNLNIKTLITLNRIEQKPLFKSDYALAKNAIKKYREDNRIENIFKELDDYSYN